MDDLDFIRKVKDNLSKSSNFYQSLIQRKKRDREIYSGFFWDTDLIADTDRKDRICRSFNLYSKYTNAIVSPFTKSPYHAEIEDPDGIYENIQSELDNIENQKNTKKVFEDALKTATTLGTGFFVLTIENGQIKPRNVRDITQIALDPSCYELDGSDASFGAVIDFKPMVTAKRLYGEDIAYSEHQYELMNFGTQWATPPDNIPVVTYFEFNDQNTVDMYELCGNKILKKITLNIDRIPIYRICFNEIIVGDKFDYNGIVDMTKDLQFGMNLAYSTLLERANRSPKASYLMTPKMYEGLEEFYKKIHTKESSIAAYNPDGDRQPIPIIEQYQTQDLMNTLQACSDLISSTIGVPSVGIQTVMRDQTATEILSQQMNSESNLGTLYDNAYQAIQSFSKNVIELLCWKEGIEKLPTFKLINGPQVITKLMKRRQELLAVSNMVDDVSRKIIAKHYIDTLDADVKDGLSADLIANSPEINWISDSTADEDPRAVNIMNKMNNVLTETQNELEQQIIENGELKKTIQELQLQLINQKSQQLLNLQEHKDKMVLENRKLNIEEMKAGLDAEAKMAELDSKQTQDQYKIASEQTKLEKELIGLEKEKMKMVNESIKEASKQIDKETDLYLGGLQ